MAFIGQLEGATEHFDVKMAGSSQAFSSDLSGQSLLSLGVTGPRTLNVRWLSDEEVSTGHFFYKKKRQVNR
jgi:hypothetical protein